MITILCNDHRNDSTHFRKSEKSDFGLPVCVGNLLDQRDYHYVNWATRSSNNRLVSKTHPPYSCRLLHYTSKRAVTCFDFLSQFRLKQNGKFSKLHFIFMGDSRMRQQFFYFLKVYSFFSQTRRQQ